MLSQTLYKLVEEAYLKPSTLLSHLSPRDKLIRYEAEEKRKITGFPTARELREAKEVAEARLRREEEEAEQVGMVRQSIQLSLMDADMYRAQKRKAKDHLHKSSKARNSKLRQCRLLTLVYSVRLLKKS